MESVSPLSAGVGQNASDMTDGVVGLGGIPALFKRGAWFEEKGFGFFTVEFFAPIGESLFEYAVGGGEFGFGCDCGGVIGKFEVTEDVDFAVSLGLVCPASSGEFAVNENFPLYTRCESCCFGGSFASRAKVV
jgi:hypothetical protein